MNNIGKYSTPRREIYAKWLEYGTKIGFILVSISFLIYVFNIIEPHIPLEQVQSHWGKSAGEYCKTIDYRAGWGWVFLIHKADFLCFTGIVFLSLVTLICYIRIFPILIKEKDYILSLICLAQIVIFILAMFGLKQ